MTIYTWNCSKIGLDRSFWGLRALNRSEISRWIHWDASQGPKPSSMAKIDRNIDQDRPRLTKIDPNWPTSTNIYQHRPKYRPRLTTIDQHRPKSTKISATGRFHYLPHKRRPRALFPPNPPPLPVVQTGSLQWSTSLFGMPPMDEFAVDVCP